MATANKRAKNARLLKNNEPTLNPLDYSASLLRALNWYNMESDNKTKKQWFQQHFGKKAGFSVTDIHEREFRTIGTLCRLLDNGNALEHSELLHMDKELARLRDLGAKIKATPKPAPVQTKPAGPTIQDRLEEQASDFIGQFNEMVDAFTMDRSAVPDVNLLMKQRPSAPVAKKAKAKLQKTIAELTETLEGKDKQLVEGYSNFTKPQLRKLLSAYETLSEKLEATKKVMAPRKTKPRPAGKVVERMKFLKEFSELGLKSVSATGVVDASEVWLYNTKSKKLQSYVAADGMLLTVKGSTLMNFDVAKSEQRTVRKPETLASLSDKGKRAFAQYYKALTTKPIACNGRVNADTLILATFK